MIRHVAQMAHETCENVRGGHGVFEKEHLITAEELRGFGKMAARITLQKGQSIGRHSHTEDGEMYIILSGCASVDDNGTPQELHAGDVMWTAHGEFHSIENRQDAPLCFLAIVVD